MAPRATWKGFFRLSLVTCPAALFPATSDSEKISFNQISRATGAAPQPIGIFFYRVRHGRAWRA